MANRLKGITLEIGGDTSSLSKSLQGVNRDIKDTQAQLKDVKKLLKMDPGNMDLLRQKQKLLTDQVKQTKDKLTELKKAQETMDANGVDKNSAQYQALQREIIETEQALKALETEAAQSNAVLSKIGAVASQVAEGAQKVSDATRGMSTAAAGALTAIGGLAYKAMTSADDLNTLAKQTGFSTAELQKFEYAADLVDVSVSDITGAATKMKKAMASGNDAFSTLGVSITNVNGTMRDVNDVFYDCLTALGGIKNETERDQLAMEIFGKSADQLAGIVDDGGKALRELGNEAERAGLILSQETLDGLNSVNDEFDRMKATSKAVLREAGAKALQALLPVLQQVVDLIARALEWIGSLSTEQIQMLTTILAIVAAISPVAGIIAKIASAVSALMPLLSTITTFIAANPIVAAIAAIIVIIGALTAYAIKNWDEIKLGWQLMCQDIANFFTEMWAKIVSAFNTAVNWLVNGFKSAFNAVLNLGKTIANGIISMIEGAINSVISKINTLISWINSVASAVASLMGASYSGISSVKSVKLKKFATGGSITSGAALVGEAGPELLTVSGGRATVTPLTATIDSKSLAALNGSGSQQTSVNIQFTGSLAQLAHVLQPAIVAETTRRGTSLV